ncbi:lysozyme C, milk isozyme-like [Sceloporus undulatus]|uniref:lysozyme C, milk isozyme-like n=1 Tax=Sceloporus undulatus TaxID=8520 RepID=UPI001C4DA542|nr:lysozyme C, milk isozyme-like [Sceloporus undulatus]
MKALDLGFLYLLLEVNEAIKYTKCELYEELLKHGLDGYNGIGIGHWMCLVLFATQYDTSHYEFTQGHPYYGVFYLSGRVWCTNERHLSMNLCKIDCEKFLDDNLKDDVECAKKVASTKGGMLSWKPFSDYCRHPMPEIVYWECITE